MLNNVVLVLFYAPSGLEYNIGVYGPPIFYLFVQIPYVWQLPETTKTYKNRLKNLFEILLTSYTDPIFTCLVYRI